ncbi:uncharacterized protein N7459_008568 [Penicillium hispanicum]|uniref:uncharacterized protein n=1 Tax=Penicillium hispanicum TaxID=1080232 RepID=UPI0025402219|nr:uncharacterized protein N7459_008568 [Penicillium hispanicum]KAJ5574141.1 hypothetical protein N7459_008568 [Penicillium hispanicum]
MTPSPPDEALHFRGKTLTPESPRPLHIPEPANIPVLENQMDPVFNDTSTYEHSYPHYSSHAQDGWSGVPQPGQEQRPGLSRDAGSLGSQPGNSARNDMTVAAADFYAPNPAATAHAANVNMDVNVNPDASHSHPPSHAHAHARAPPVVSVPQGLATSRELDIASASETSRLPDRLDDAKEDAGSKAAGVNFQTLLDNLTQPATSATAATTGATPASAAAPAPAGAYLAEGSSLSQASPDESLQSQGLPARPPLQEPPSHPNYAPNDDLSYHQLPPPPPSAYAAQSSNHDPTFASSMAPVGPPGTVQGVGSLPPPPIASFQQAPSTGADSQTSQETVSQAPKKGRTDKPAVRPPKGDDDSPWGPDVQKKYDEFLHDERVYVTEGLWDRFPMGSRLFVGNLPTERVTKRDMFHIFHKYGKLAQISIKQAYGFIQFLEAGSCHAALQAEQGALVRGRKIHLEISKPQRSTRPAPSEPLRAPPPRRSRSPEFTRAGPARTTARASGDRYDRAYEPSRLPFSDFRDELGHRRRDDYRPPRSPRSPSPRPFRARDGYRSRDRTPERFDRRDRRRSRSPRSPRSPYMRDRRYRSPSPRPRGVYEGEADLPVPRRSPRDVPEVQVLVLEEVDRNFILHVENAFRNRGLRVDVLVLGPRIPLGAAVHRQYVEGVLAVVRLSRPNQFSRKIPLQIFDRSAGLDNVRFSDYPEVDPNIAAELMFHQAQAMQRGAPPATFAPNPAFGVPTVAPVPAAQASLPTLTNPPNIANLISSLDGPSLQSLLSALQRPAPPSQPVSTHHSPFASPNPPPPADLASLLANATRPAPIPPAVQQHPSLPPFTLQPPPNAPVVSDPNLLSLLAKGLGGQQPQGQPGVGANVQNLMNQLAKWKQ